MAGWRAEHNIEIKKEDFESLNDFDTSRGLHWGKYYDNLKGKYVTDYPEVRQDFAEALRAAKKEMQGLGNDIYLTGAHGTGHASIEHQKFGTAADLQPRNKYSLKQKEQLKKILEKHGIRSIDEGNWLHAIYDGDYNKYKQQKAKQKSSTGKAANQPTGTQNPYTHPEVNYDPTQRIYSRNGQILKPASTQENQPPVTSKPFGREPIYQSPNNAAIAATLGSAAGAGVAATIGSHYLYQEAATGAVKYYTMTTTAEIYEGSATGYAASLQGTSAWSAATNAVSSAWSAATTAIGNAVSWIGGAISTIASTVAGAAVAGAAVAVAGAIASAVAGAAAAVGVAIGSALGWLGAIVLAFPW